MTPMTPDAVSALQNAGFSRRGFLKGAGALIGDQLMGQDQRQEENQAEITRLRREVERLRRENERLLER